MLQIATILVLMVAAPIVAIAVEAATGGNLIALSGKWFVFFFGLRLLTAGIHQCMKPEFTAQTIFRIADPNARKIVKELGFANIAMDALGVVTIFNAAWVVPGATVLTIFYMLAGSEHVLHEQRTSSETWAMGSDLWAAVVLAGWLFVNR